MLFAFISEIMNSVVHCQNTQYVHVPNWANNYSSFFNQLNQSKNDVFWKQQEISLEDHFNLDENMKQKNKIFFYFDSAKNKMIKIRFVL